MKTTDTQDTAATSEQAADLAALHAAATEGEAASPGQGQGTEAAPAVPDLSTEIVGLVTVAVAALGPMFPSLKATYTPEVTQAAAEAIARVCMKHGWLQGGLVGEWGEEIACAAIVGPLAFQTYTGIKADIEARKPKKTERIDGPSAAPAPAAAKTVQFGTVAAEAVPVEAAA